MIANLTAEQRNGLSEGFCREYPDAPGMLGNLKEWSAVSLQADAETKRNKRRSQHWLCTFLLHSCVVYLADKFSQIGLVAVLTSHPEFTNLMKGLRTA